MLKPFLFTVVLSGCAAALPATPPRTSAASREAASGRALVVGVALTSEPPLPGESTTGWEGLETAASTAPHHHGHHHGH